MHRQPISSDIEIRRIRSDEWPAFRELRLAALETDPLAFGSTHAGEIAYSDEKWQSWAQDGAEGEATPTFVGARPGAELVGMVGLFRREAEFVVWGMWVAPDFRRMKLGSKLMQRTLRWIDQYFPGSSVLLSVNPTLRPAVRTYLGQGFVFTGKEEPLGHDSPAIIREMMRVRT